MKAVLEIIKFNVKDIITTSGEMNVEPGAGGTGTIKSMPINPGTTSVID